MVSETKTDHPRDQQKRSLYTMYTGGLYMQVQWHGKYTPEDL